MSVTYIDQHKSYQSPKAAISHHPSIFTEIYQEEVNIAVWRRELTDELNMCVKDLLEKHNHYEKTLVLTEQEAYRQLMDVGTGLREYEPLCRDISELVDMFCLLYEVKRVGLRLATLNTAMCPRFHVDKVPCRLVCTYDGVATEWLPHEKVDRTKLGRGNNGLIDEESGLYSNQDDVNQLQVGDVAMLKGELWQGNEGAGLVHRSPILADKEKRLLLTLDFVS